ncbi:hypothetical protein RUM44_004755 [Polyplax serrata]|uniref:Chitin-binding type-2 domain-containing protein n=1 Tax=Polyplax serrata TaxID=468196 RepID=A0ABR1B3R0_POLSC
MMKTVLSLLLLVALSHQVPLEGENAIQGVEVTTNEAPTTTDDTVKMTTEVEIEEPELPEITPFGVCPEEDVDFPTYLSDMKNCSVFYQCAHGVPFRMTCRFPLEFNPVFKVCDYPFASGCLLSESFEGN